MRHASAVMYVAIANSRWRGKRSRLSRRMRNPQFFVSGKRHMVLNMSNRSMTSMTKWCNYIVSLVAKMKLRFKHIFIISQIYHKENKYQIFTHHAPVLPDPVEPR